MEALDQGGSQLDFKSYTQSIHPIKTGDFVARHTMNIAIKSLVTALFVTALCLTISNTDNESWFTAWFLLFIFVGIPLRRGNQKQQKIKSRLLMLASLSAEKKNADDYHTV